MITFDKHDDKAVRKKSKVLIEKYRPLTLKNIILPPRYRKFFDQIVSEGEIPNLLIHSNSPGVGKTTIAKALANDCGYDHIYINTSLYGGIDTLRGDISQYATVKSFDGRRKVVILDEFDGASANLQAGLRGAIEEFYDKCRFILTANSINKIIAPLQSRCQVINFDFTDRDKKNIDQLIVKRLEGIATKEKISFQQGIMSKVVDAYYPDIRKMINIISEYSRQYEIIDDNIFNFKYIDDTLASLILSLNIADARKYINDNNCKIDDLYRYVFDFVIPKVPNDFRGELYKVTSEYIDMATRSWDQEITFVGFLVTIMQIIGGDVE